MVKFISALILTLSLVSGHSFASGGTGGNGSATKHYQEKYDLGKRVMETKVLCDACPFADTQLDDESALLVSKQLKKHGDLSAVLSKKERKAAKYYLKKRF